MHDRNISDPKPDYDEQPEYKLERYTHHISSNRKEAARGGTASTNCGTGDETRIRNTTRRIKYIKGVNYDIYRQ